MELTELSQVYRWGREKSPLMPTWPSLSASQDAMEELTMKMTPSGQLPSPALYCQGMHGAVSDVYVGHAWGVPSALTTTLPSLSASHEAMEEQTVKMTPSGQMPSPGGLSQSLKGISMTLLLNSS